MTMTFRFSKPLPLTLRTGASLLIVFGLTGCEGLAHFAVKTETPAPPPTEETRPAPPVTTAAEQPKEPDKPLKAPLYEWKGTGQPITRIVINTDEQKARFYSGETEIGWTTVATGVAKYPTPTGRFQITEKIENKRSNLYGKIYGQEGRLLHANAKVGRDPIPEGARFEGAHMPFYLRLTGDGIGLHAGPIPNPGRPASHGCIRMPSKIAPVVFRHVSTGTPVTIEGKGPSYSEYLAQQRTQAARVAAAAPAKPPAAAAGAPTAQNKPAAETKPAEAAADTAAQPPGPEVTATNQPPAPPPVNAANQQTAPAPAPSAPLQPAQTIPAEPQQTPRPTAPPVPASAASLAAPAQPAQPEPPQPPTMPSQSAQGTIPAPLPQNQTPQPPAASPESGQPPAAPAPPPQPQEPAAPQPPTPVAQPQAAAPA
ncbi:L,D-transpeptidase [Caldichromatium japonicum]|uniref:L,D-transpeptidase n=1 Tax=Caldichromatium japonicum TaxID=2699430 RepID=A0A6G7VBF2_9GAMM|nr:L,D-transpeptidase [Caldichromatium japonicum]QIK37403.1 L,D-transpeptidase [Caldichromatium japonicum]